MSIEDVYDDGEGQGWSRHDSREIEARGKLIELFEKDKKGVFFSRQLEVRLEDEFFHWITNRAIRGLAGDRFLRNEVRSLQSGGDIHLLWHRSYRYNRRSGSKIMKLVDSYADPNIAGAVGLHGEAMVLEAYARHQFVMRGRNTSAYAGKEWKGTGHNMDFIFERDGLAYGVEVKNTLGYMDHDELWAKIRICQFLGIRPVFVCRMLPKPWIKEVIDGGGFALILKWQLYPWTHKELAKRVSSELGLPVDAPRAIGEGAIGRFLRWHEALV